MSILEVENLKLSFLDNTDNNIVVNNISFSLKKGEILAIVGESGAGKSITAYSIMQLLNKDTVSISGSIKYNGNELINLREKELNNIRGKKIAMIFQNPTSCMNPVYNVGNQIIEVIKTHNKTTKKKDAKLEAINILKYVGINFPEKRMKQFPHELSGGMCQRIMIALALVNTPDILIADEPTTSLDAVTQAKILQLIKKINIETNMSVILITHDINVAKNIAHNVIVMKDGKIVEKDEANKIFSNPQNNYTKHLLEIANS